MTTTKPKPKPVAKVIANRRTFVARLILAEAIARRGQGPLERKRIVYRSRKA